MPWEDINNSYHGVFGYTEKLSPNPLITKKVICDTLKDIDLLRKNPKMYPTESLNVWEYKLSNWLKLFDDNSDDNDNEQQQVILIL